MGDVTPLAALIRREIERATDEGRRMNYQTIADAAPEDLRRGEVQKWATQKIKQMITLEKRRGLALGLRVHPVVVDRAVAESLDVMLEPPADDWRSDPDLLAEDRRAIADFINYRRSMRRNPHDRGNSRQHG